MGYDVTRLKSEIKALVAEQIVAKANLKKAQRELSAQQRLSEKDQSQKTMWALGDQIGRGINAVADGRERLTLHYMIRAAMRGRLHMSKQVIHNSNGTKEVVTWTLENQMNRVEDYLSDYKTPDIDQSSKPAA